MRSPWRALVENVSLLEEPAPLDAVSNGSIPSEWVLLVGGLGVVFTSDMSLPIALSIVVPDGIEVLLVEPAVFSL